MGQWNTIFYQMLKLIRDIIFYRLERQHGTGRPTRTFSRGHQLVHLSFIQVTSRDSLREGVGDLKASFTNLYRLEERPVACSIFADFNNRWPSGFFAALFARRYQR